MNLEEETFLTAYLDGELPPGPREGVESTLASDPRLAEDLRRLTAVRDLVAGLPRPAAPVDVSAAVVARLGRRPAKVWAVRVAALFASAAALVGAVTVGLLQPPPAPDRALSALPRPRPTPPIAPPSVDEPAPTPSVGPAFADLGPDRNEAQRANEAQRVHRLLDSPNLRKVFVVTDSFGGEADRHVGSILEKTPRRESAYGRMTVAEEIAIDPEHPGKATVYVVVLDDRELARLRAQLNRAFPGSVRENDSRPEVVTQLADIGQVAVLPGTPVTDLVDRRITERERAIRTTPGKDHVAHVSKSLVLPPGYDADPLHDPNRYREEVASPEGGPTPEQYRSGSHPGPSDVAKTAEPPPAEKSGQQNVASTPTPGDGRRTDPRLNVVLVWVATPTNRGVR